MAVVTRKFEGGLTVLLAGGETFDIRRNTGRPLLRVTMGSDELAVTLESLTITESEEDDLGQSGWDAT